jgi:glutamate/aspartate transport system substrate-binding protein
MTTHNRRFLLALLALAAGAAHAEPVDTLKKIKDSGTVTMGVRDSSGLSYTLGNGVYGGFHVEVCQKVLADVKKQLGLANLTIKYTPVTSQNRVPLVQNGTVDIECGSTTTYVEEVRMAVRANSGITSISQLGGKTVSTTTGTTSVQTLRKHERATGVDLKELYGKDHSDSFLMLESGRADAFVMDVTILASNIAKSKKPSDYKIVGEVLSVEPIAIMLSKDDPAFKKAVDTSLKGLIASGEMTKLWDKWFLKPVPPTNTTVGLQLSETTRAAWANPNDKPLEEYAAKK